MTPVEFDVKPWADRLAYFRVIVTDTQPELVHQIAHVYNYRITAGSNPGAACAPERGEPFRIGYVFLSRQQMGSGTVAHELFHAAMRACEYGRDYVVASRRPHGLRRFWWRLRLAFIENKRWEAERNPEEALAYALDHLTTDYWRAFYRLGLDLHGGDPTKEAADG